MPNRLTRETSPYLLQHAHNPVDWHPWGDEALARAREEDRPILLSIGYSSCHWCHVMERESFEDTDVAALMNERFVNIKVDREERPDIDQIYMRAVQAMTGGGGWPLTVFLTPGGEPYYGGTYFPPAPRHGLPSFRQVLEAAARAYQERPEDVRETAAKLRTALDRSTRPETAEGAATGAPLLDEGFRALARQYDAAHGGFGGAPKFPQPVTLDVLLRHHVRTGEGEALEMAVHTLRRMAAGGIRDHLGGGFHRYSVDARWLVPHFEKMLYDNVLLARAYLDAFRVTGAEDLREVAEDTLRYMLADLLSPEGGFYAARDADSEGEEGTFYLWSPDQVEALLGGEAELFCRTYDVSPPGNFEGRSILHLPHDLDAVARREQMDPDELRARLARSRAALLEARAHRPEPFRDEKIIASWNGMALRAFAEAGAALGRPEYVEAAADAADFLLDALRSDDGLFRIHAAGRAHVPALLEDWAALGNGLLSLHEATLDAHWLEPVVWICEAVQARFWDEGPGAFYDGPAEGERLIVRPRDPMDNATPSGNSLAAELLLRAGHLLGEDAWKERARRVVQVESAVLARFPTAFGRLLSVADQLEAEPVEIALVGDRTDPGLQALHRGAAAPYLRNRTLTGRDPAQDLRVHVPVLQDRGLVEGRAAAYVCRRYACRRPVTTPVELAAELAS